MVEKLIDYIEMDEFRKILKIEKDKRFKLGLVLGFGSGLRISEIIGLHSLKSRCCGEDVSEEKKVIDGKKRKFNVCSKCGSILKQKDTYRDKKEWQIKPLTKEQINLKEHQIKVIGGKGQKDRIASTSPWLTETNIKLLPLKIPRRTFQSRIKALGKKVLKRDISPHTLRHGYGNYMVNEKNVPLPIVQALMGHARLETTGIYTKANPKKAANTAFEAF